MVFKIGVFLGTLILVSCNQSGDTTDYPINDPFIIAVKGSDYKWHFQYPGKDGEIGTADDLESIQYFRVPAKTNILFMG